MDVLQGALNRAVTLNGLLLPLEAVHAALTKYVNHLCVRSNLEDWPFSLAGSTTLLAYKSRFFAICCRHQLIGHDPENVCLIVNGGKDVITSGGSSMFQSVNETDFHDLVAFDFTEPCNEGVLSRNLFFSFAALPPNHLSDDVVFIICAGFPFSDQNYEVDEGRLGSGRRVVLCKLGRDGADAALKKAVALDPLAFNPDGMSGGSAFVCLDCDGDLEAFYAGVIVRGGKDGFYFVHSGAVRRFLDLVIDRKNGAKNFADH